MPKRFKNSNIIICDCGKICYSEEDYQDHLEFEDCSYNNSPEYLLKRIEKRWDKYIDERNERWKEELKKYIRKEPKNEKELEFLVMLTGKIYCPKLNDIIWKYNGYFYWKWFRRSYRKKDRIKFDKKLFSNN